MTRTHNDIGCFAVTAGAPIAITYRMCCPSQVSNGHNYKHVLYPFSSAASNSNNYAQVASEAASTAIGAEMGDFLNSVGCDADISTPPLPKWHLVHDTCGITAPTANDNVSGRMTMLDAVTDTKGPGRAAQPMLKIHVDTPAHMNDMHRTSSALSSFRNILGIDFTPATCSALLTEV